ncbi:MAG: hypothetical protein KGI29_04930 [Pseudomonadota bacterium]|nr:hypothetical protein [Pseudomonadota bacterium]MDE3038465.1 hypothetical protein [Pseudomonadota bacterium]
MPTVKLSGDLVNQAKCCGRANGRSVPEQIEYWSKMARTCEDNPDLPYEFIRNIFEAMEEPDSEATEYKFG